MKYLIPGNGIQTIKISINRLFEHSEPWQVATITATTVLWAIWFWNFLKNDQSVWVRMKNRYFHYLKKVPYIRQTIDNEVDKINVYFEKEMAKSCLNLNYYLKLPTKGLGKEEILQLVDDHLNLGNYKWQNGRVSGAVYAYDTDLVDIITKVYGKASYTNPLHPDIFPGICKMEADVVRMACDILHGDQNSCGTMTTGGTESILMACKAYRDYARELKNITQPNMIVPKTAHAAFDKAAQYFNISIRYVNVNPVTCEVDLVKFKRAINSNTILLVGSAPNFPYGTADDIQAIAKLGLHYNIPVHVDACLGSFIIALASEAGYAVKPFNFSVKGVTSISVDTHKYGFAPKGSSVILYSDQKYRNYQYTVTTDWPGGVYGSPTINGSRAGGIIASCWATMINIGRNGYLEATKRILRTSRYIEREVRKIDGIYVFGTPVTTVIAIGSKSFDIYCLADTMCTLGWNLNNLQFPPGIHICVTDMHTAPGVAEEFLNDLRRAVQVLLENPKQQITEKMAFYGKAQSLPDRSIVADVTRGYLNSMYYTPIKNLYQLNEMK